MVLGLLDLIELDNSRLAFGGIIASRTCLAAQRDSHWCRESWWRRLASPNIQNIRHKPSSEDYQLALLLDAGRPAEAHTHLPIAPFGALAREHIKGPRIDQPLRFGLSRNLQSHSFEFKIRNCCGVPVMALSPTFSSEDVANDWKEALEDLREASEHAIYNLVTIARENLAHAQAISRVTINHIKNVSKVL